MSVRKAVIPIAGFATRFLPACKSVPKCMLTILDKPIIQYIVDEAVASGIEEIVMVIGRKKEVVQDYFKEDEELKKFLIERNKEKFLPLVTNISHGAKIHFIEQDGGAKGLGHAIYQARDIIGNEPFAILYGSVDQLGNVYALEKGTSTITVSEDGTKARCRVSVISG